MSSKQFLLLSQYERSEIRNKNKSCDWVVLINVNLIIVF